MNPYTLQTRFYTEHLDINECRASIPMVRKVDCLGHFNHFPALPVARIAEAMIDLSGIQYNLIRGQTNNYCVRKTTLNAKSLIFAGEKVELKTYHIKDNKEDGIQIKSVAQTSSHSSAVEMNFWFY
jgi:3-hydroxymyristoyl/3-hydroxydecanoyl-(acyl carrier protein) dehydratase